MIERLGSVLSGRRIGTVVAAALLAAPLGAVLQPVAASAANPAATFTPAIVRTGGSVTLNVTTDSGTNCVRVTGAHNPPDQKVTGGGATSWTFGPFAANTVTQ